MNTEMLLTVCGTIIVGLLIIIGWFLVGVMAKMDSVSKNVNQILTINGITNEKLNTHEAQIHFMQAKLHDNADKWAELWKDYDIPKRN